MLTWGILGKRKEKESERGRERERERERESDIHYKITLLTKRFTRFYWSLIGSIGRTK